ncbi:RNA polymerase sigma factor [Acutalibacter sp. 1XD8-36]|uniref:RNA polymerase sigma factor n=1 Tax=Acutalibacter sp. 1XD8-36 TaxID=2320852 RepID=UPI0014123019|nr:sigma-70 family RNA polymerase sigma factor [Acutalibacter sp. 1XD8-36]
MDISQTAGKELSGQQYEPHAAPLTMDEVVTVYSRTVYAIALAKTGTREDAEDVFQEIFLSYVRKRPKFEDERQGRVWFSRATVYCCKMLWRTKKRHETLPMEAAEGIEFTSGEDRELLMELRNLPKKHREVLELIYFGGLSTGEAAKVLGCSPNAVRIRLSRARTALEKRLK